MAGVVGGEDQAAAAGKARLAFAQDARQRRDGQVDAEHRPQAAVGTMQLHRSEGHTSELQSPMRIEYAVLRLQKKYEVHIISDDEVETIRRSHYRNPRPL